MWNVEEASHGHSLVLSQPVIIMGTDTVMLPVIIMGRDTVMLPVIIMGRDTVMLPVIIMGIYTEWEFPAQSQLTVNQPAPQQNCCSYNG